VGAHRRDECVLGRRDAGFVEEDVGALQARCAEFEAMGRGDAGAKLLEGEEMGVQAAAADHVTAGRWQRHRATTGE
jgi:hypothetical protein